jgi:hypothetical protein
MSPDAMPLATAERALALWTEVAVAYDGIERRLAAGQWEGFDEVAAQIADLERELLPLLVVIAAGRAATPTPTPELASRWRELDQRIEALARRQKQLETAAVSARDTTAARLVRTRIARSRATGYTPLNPLSPRIASTRV